MKEIGEWLEKGGPSYAQGVALYAAHGKSRVVLKSLQYGETAFTRATLVRELGRLAESDANASASAPRPAKNAPAVAVAAKTASANPHEPPPDKVRHQRSAWYAERHRLHGQLELLASDEARRVASERILDLSDSLTVSYQAAPEPALPRPDLAAVADQGEIRRLLANLRPQASKLKKNPGRTLDLQQVQADIEILEKNLVKP